VTRELKLALIVGFALVLVVTVLISDHLSHARQTKLASLPPDPAKVTEPLPIALENGASSLPQTSVTEPVAHAPAPLIGSMPGTDTEPLVIAQGAGTAPLTQPNVSSPATFDLINPTPQASQIAQNTGANAGVQPIASSTRRDPIEEAVRSAGGSIQGNNIYIPGVQTSREQMPRDQTAGMTSMPQNTGTAPVAPRPLVTTPAPMTPAPLNVTPATPERLHTVASGDNLFKLSTRYYNDGKAWRKLAKYNGIDAETPLKVGQKLKVPAAEVLLGRPATTARATLGQTNFDSVRGISPLPGGTSRPTVVEPRTVGVSPAPLPLATAKTRPYTVKKGDSLAVIAQRELGTTKRAKDILELNRKVIKNPDNVPLGATILLPAA
jgi:LysM repeat protein